LRAPKDTPARKVLPKIWNTPTSIRAGQKNHNFGMARVAFLFILIFFGRTDESSGCRRGRMAWRTFAEIAETAFVIVSHDRYFLDRTCRRIIEIEKAKP